MTIRRLGSISFSIAISAMGILHLLISNFQSMRFKSDASMYMFFLEFLFWAGLIVLSIGILLSNKPHVPAKWIGSLMFIWIFIRHVPLLISDLSNPAEWNFTGMALAICGGAFIVASSCEEFLSTDRKFSVSIPFPPLKQVGQILLGFGLSVLGFQHLYYADFISSMIPFWIPVRITCTWITGIALMLAGISFLFNLKMLQASFALSIMILCWIIVLHLPRIISAPRDLYEWIYGFQALAVTMGSLTLFGMQRRLAKLTVVQDSTFLDADQITPERIKQVPELDIPFAHPQKNYKPKGSKSQTFRSASFKR